MRSASGRPRATRWWALLAALPALAACEILAGIPDVVDGREAGACPALDPGGCGGGACGPALFLAAQLPTGIAIHGGTLYWAESNKVVGVSTEAKEPMGSWASVGPEEVVAGADGVYWTEGTFGCIHHGPKGGGPATAIGGCKGTRGGQLALDETHVYWAVMEGSGECDGDNPCCDAGGTGCILRAPKDGGGEVHVYAADETAPLGVAVDAEYVYWSSGVGSKNGRILRCRKEGCDGEPEVLVAELDQVTRLAIDGEHLYFLDKGKGRVQRALTTAEAPSDSVELVADDMIYGGSLAVDDTHVYWAAGSTIGRRRKLLDAPAETVGGANAHSVAVDCLHVYWTEQDPGAGTGMGIVRAPR